jgi:hypothetical protein
MDINFLQIEKNVNKLKEKGIMMNFIQIEKKQNKHA